MKKILTILVAAAVLQACNSGNNGEGGTTNDGFEGVGDANGAIVDTINATSNPSIDSSVGEGRVDVQPRNGTAETPK